MRIHKHENWWVSHQQKIIYASWLLRFNRTGWAKRERVFARDVGRLKTAHKYRWKDFDFDSCPSCSGSLEAHTQSRKEGWFYDGDMVRCENRWKGCEAINLQISVDDEHAYVTGEW